MVMASVSYAYSTPASATYRARTVSLWFLDIWGSNALADKNARTSPVSVRRIMSARTTATPCSLPTSRVIVRMATVFRSDDSSPSAPGHEHGDHVDSAFLVDLAASGDRPIEDGDLHELAVRGAGTAGTVGDRGHASVERRVGDGSVPFRRRSGLQAGAGPVRQRERFQPFELLLGEKDRCRLALAVLDTTG